MRPLRTKLALAAVLAGTFAAFAPHASAQCTPPIIDNGQQCADNGCDTYDKLREKFTKLPPRPFECTQ